MMPLRWSALLRVALGAVALQLYCAPLRALEQELGCYPHCTASSNNSSNRSVEGSGVGLHEQFQDVMFLRMWLTFALTLYALCGVISKQVVLVSLLHAAIHFARSISEAPPIVASPSSSLLDVLFYWRNSRVESCVYEYGALLSFALLLRYVLFPPAHNLKRFFSQHDKQFVPLVDRLLEEYTGHERLLYARIRRLYNSSNSGSHKASGAPVAQLQTP
ncbi:hypothetical protein Gpo141_00010108 [Globisporangium polare]